MSESLDVIKSAGPAKEAATAALDQLRTDYELGLTAYNDIWGGGTSSKTAIMSLVKQYGPMLLKASGIALPVGILSQPGFLDNILGVFGKLF